LCCAVLSGCDDREVIVEEGGLTPAEALAHLRARRAAGDSSPATVVVRGAVRISEPIVLTAADSDLTVRGEEGATISGGLEITGWTDRGGGVWGAKLPARADGKPIFTETLFVDGRRAPRARYPAEGFFRVASVSQAVCQASVTTNRIFLGMDASERAVKMLAALPKDELAFAQLLAHVKWTVSRMPVTDASGTQIVVDGEPMKPWCRWSGEDLYALENVRPAFTQEGQWFYDARAGEALYRPRAGEVVRTAIAPVDGLETLLAVDGATNVVFEGVTFAHSAPTGGRGPTRVAPFQAAALAAKAAVVVDRSADVSFRGCRFEHLGSYALWFREGCRGGGAFSCVMTDLGAGGVRIGAQRRLQAEEEAARAGVDMKVPYVERAPWMTSHVAVEDCEISHGGRFHPAGVGVLLTHASDCAVVHNDIFDLFYTGVSVGWVWGYSGSPSQRNTVAFNHIRDIGQGRLADMGGVYTLGASFGTCVSNNVIHAVRSYSYGGWGLYTDEGSEGVVMENNVVYDTDDASFHQHYGRDNILRNNILVDSRAGQVAVTRAEPHRSLTVERNIVVWTQGDAFVRYTGTKTEQAKIDWKRNLWWRTDGQDVFNGTPFADWRRRVKDEGSVFADPLFADWRRHDFALAPESPALACGFRPFDVSAAGRTGRPLPP
ncbi:MAG: right-handed parallel beta-helix repeat-containing protein, partial [Kiritimatiellae bacterium]|nr:right-handed parallel beta-helix repeat-containing protein [Kiritimatiellia bacterium]